MKIVLNFFSLRFEAELFLNSWTLDWLMISASWWVRFVRTLWIRHLEKVNLDRVPNHDAQITRQQIDPWANIKSENHPQSSIWSGLYPFTCHLDMPCMQSFFQDQTLSREKIAWNQESNRFLTFALSSSWWFQAIWKILVKLDHLPK